MYLISIFFSRTIFANEDCGGPMVIRKILPLHQAEDVPLNTQVFVALVGNGTEEHMRVSLRENIGGLDVDFALETACYEHESSTELHCNYWLTPHTVLKEETEYQISLNGTELHAEGDFGYNTTFTTGIEQIEMKKDAPNLFLHSYVPRPLDAVGECDWQYAMKYELEVRLIHPDPNRITLIHTYEVDPVNCTEQIVHTVFPIASVDSFDFHQVLEPGTEGARCYRSEHHDGAGNTTDSSSILCWNMAFDSAQDEQEEIEENTEGDSSLSNPTAQETVVVQKEGGCSAIFWGLPLFLWRRNHTLKKPRSDSSL
jgi:hypothetical protein